MRIERPEFDLLETAEVFEREGLYVEAVALQLALPTIALPTKKAPSREAIQTPFYLSPNSLRAKSVVSAHGRLHDLVGIADGLAALDLVDVFHAGDDLAPGGVLLVEKTGVVEADEKLRIG